MNAYEIADELQKHGLNGDNHGLFNKRIQNMLRQQADRIAELEKPHKYDPETGEPLIDGYPLFSGLPRPQTKPLSNDEILEMTIWNKNLYELYVEMDKEDMIAFARAIEERHGIKNV